MSKLKIIKALVLPPNPLPDSIYYILDNSGSLPVFEQWVIDSNGNPVGDKCCVAASAVPTASICSTEDFTNPATDDTAIGGGVGLDFGVVAGGSLEAGQSAGNFQNLTAKHGFGWVISAGSDALYISNTAGTARKIEYATGNVVTIAGQYGSMSTVDGALGVSRIDRTETGAINPVDGNFYIAETSGQKKIRKIDITTNNTTTFADVGETVISMAFDSSGNMYLGTAGLSPKIFKVDPSGNSSILVSSADNAVRALAVDDANDLLYYTMADQVGGAFHNQIGTYQLSTGSNKTLILDNPNGDIDGNVSTARIGNAYESMVLLNGFLWFADQQNNKIKKLEISTGTITTVAGSGTAGDVDGSALSAQMNKPTGITQYNGDIYIFEHFQGNKVKKYDPVADTVTTVSGSTTGNFDTNGTSTGGGYSTGSEVLGIYNTPDNFDSVDIQIAGVTANNLISVDILDSAGSVLINSNLVNGSNIIDLSSLTVQDIYLRYNFDNTGDTTATASVGQFDIYCISASSTGGGSGGAGDNWGMQTVATDATLSGDGTIGNPLSVAGGGSNGDDWGNQVVISDNKITGVGTTASPLSVDENNLNIPIGNITGLNTTSPNGGNVTGSIDIINGTFNLNAPTGGGGTTGDNWGTQTAVSNNSLTGNGTTASPLAVDGTNVNIPVTNLTGQTTISGNGGNVTGSINLITGQFTLTAPTGGTSTGDNWGTQSVVSDNKLTGNGTTASPLSVNENNLMIPFSNVTGFIIDTTTLSGNGTAASPLTVINSGTSFTGVSTDATINGDGATNPLGVNVGSIPVVTDTTVTGDGTTGNPLSVAPQDTIYTANGTLNNRIVQVQGGGIRFGGTAASSSFMLDTIKLRGFNITEAVLSDQNSLSTYLPSVSGVNYLGYRGSGGAFAHTGNMIIGGETNMYLKTPDVYAGNVPAGWIPVTTDTLGKIEYQDPNNIFTGSGGSGGDNWGTQTVVSDATLTGNGTTASPLSVAANSNNAVTTDNSLSGDGTAANPLMVNDNFIYPLWSNIQNMPSTLAVSGGNVTGNINLQNGTFTLVAPTGSGSGGDNWGTQVVQSDGTLTGTGVIGDVLRVDENSLVIPYANLSGLPALNQVAGNVQGTINLANNTFALNAIPDWTDVQNLPTLASNGGNVTGTIDLSTGQFTLTAPTGSGGTGGDNWGSQTVVSNNSLTGNGTTASPLAVDGTNVNIPVTNLTGQTTISDNGGNVTGSINLLTGQFTLTAPTGGGGGTAGDNWGSQTVVSDATLTGNGTSASPLSVASVPDGFISNVQAGTAGSASIQFTGQNGAFNSAIDLKGLIDLKDINGTYTNGLTLTGNDVDLGGTLEKSTTIDGDEKYSFGVFAMSQFVVEAYHDKFTRLTIGDGGSMSAIMQNGIIFSAGLTSSNTDVSIVLDGENSTGNGTGTININAEHGKLFFNDFSVSTSTSTVVPKKVLVLKSDKSVDRLEPSELPVTEIVSSVPSSASAGTDGTIKADENYIYVKVGSGWKRAAISSF